MSVPFLSISAISADIISPNTEWAAYANQKTVMTQTDLIIGPIVFVFIMTYAILYYATIRDNTLKKLYFPALILKLAGGIAMGLVYQTHYGIGDTFNYYFHASLMYEAFSKSPELWFKLMTWSGDEINSHAETVYYGQNMFWEYDPHAFFLIRIASLFGLVCMHNYAGISFLMTAFSFYGLVSVYRVFTYFYPSIKRQIGLVVFFIPSVLMWTSGLLKDTVALTGICFIVKAFFDIFIIRKRILSNLILLLFFVWVVLQLRPFIVFMLAPPFLLWFFYNKIDRIRPNWFRYLSIPLFTTTIILGGYATVMLTGIGSGIINGAPGRIYASATWIASVGERMGGSVYTLGDIQPTWASIISLFPKAVNVSLFRPYLWEVKSFLMVFSALESFFILLLFLRVLYKRGVLGILEDITTQPMVNVMITFSILSAFIIGVGTWNFGSLIRYKATFIIFFLSALIIMLNRAKVYREQPKSQQHSQQPN